MQGLIAYISHSIRPVHGGWLIVAAVIGIAAAVPVRRRPVTVYVLTAYVVLVLLSTVVLRRDSRLHYGSDNLILMPFWSYSAWITGKSPGLLYEDLANILMTVPVGFCVTDLAGEKKLCWVLISALLLELVIEGSQLVFHRGLCETDDVLSGLLGALLGYGLYLLAVAIVRCLRRRGNE